MTNETQQIQKLNRTKQNSTGMLWMIKNYSIKSSPDAYFCAACSSWPCCPCSSSLCCP